ncbi:hypothetical protein GCM10010390_91180 [Streptomyces mordarskii]|uniref:Uncharacterized protein n=1 Tax=Streptomyces mordarskii TaxID=1226758 RepID=A0ABP3PVE0_9ACTN
MHDLAPCRHIHLAACPDLSETRDVSSTSSHAFVLVRDTADHELATTASRQLRRPDDFLAAARYMIEAGYHPKAGRTTLRLAEVFAARMRRSSRGHFALSAEATARELELKKRAVMYHARYLRELGLIAYVEHGSKTNVLRTRRGSAWQPGDGYRGTATVFAAVAPRVWDDAHGRRIAGTGYTARITGVTGAGRVRAVEEARRKASRRRPRRTSCTPSVVVPKDHRQVQVVGSKNYTPRQRATCPKTSRPTTTDRSPVSPTECARGITLTERLQGEVWWLHRACPRRLAYALRPLITIGWTWQGLAAELLTWAVPGYLRDPAAYVRHELARRQRLGNLTGVAPPEVPADDGTRHAAMLRNREERNAPIWQRYAQQLRPVLRRRLAAVRQSLPRQRNTAVEYRSWLREDEEDFARSLPMQSWDEDISPLEVYRARAFGAPLPAPRHAKADRGWLEHLRDQRDAERAFGELRAELEEWEAVGHQVTGHS